MQEAVGLSVPWARIIFDGNGGLGIYPPQEDGPTREFRGGVASDETQFSAIPTGENPASECKFYASQDRQSNFAVIVW